MHSIRDKDDPRGHDNIKPRASQLELYEMVSTCPDGGKRNTVDITSIITVCADCGLAYDAQEQL